MVARKTGNNLKQKGRYNVVMGILVESSYTVAITLVALTLAWLVMRWVS